jgi:multicomponent Na+:H+ antiporter subunit E
MNNAFYDLRLFVTLLIFWVALTASFQPMSLFLGVLVSVIVIIITHIVIKDDYESILKEIKIFRFLKFSAVVIIEIYLSSFYHIFKIVKNDSKSMVLTVELECSDPLLVTFIANAITLTPGTITLDIDDQINLIVLAIVRDEEEIQEIKDKIINKYQRILMGR